MNKVWSDEALDDYIYWQSQDRKTLKRISQLIKDIERNASKAGGYKIRFVTISFFFMKL
ncbi:type II toxin-antitoxin system YoeB family toxin [Clostridium beijerinckii]|uniref:Endoribonuclease YoeB n=1 Tax=Clostridium beijerinckii TaxID=1520 RepID=A0AB74VQ98_CLOBE|nr:type II toxin-antitoxin system YoeB family toxin [Clostridium beijerinckii]